MAKSILLILSLLFVSCGKVKRWVTDIDYKFVDYNQQQWVVAEFKVNLGNNKFQETLEILPRDYGTFRTLFKEDQNIIGLDLNISSILNLPSGVGTLPNGDVIPIDIGNNGIVEIPFKKLAAKAYLAKTDDSTIIGIAVKIKQLDNLNLGDITIYPEYTLGGVDLVAGVFISSDPGQSGLAIFADLKSIASKHVRSERNLYVLDKEYISKRRKKQLYRKLKYFLNQKKQLELIKN